MNLHEYQAKQLYAEYAIPTTIGEVADSPAQAMSIAKRLDCKGWMVKAQVHAGGRGKAGGVKFAKTVEEVGQQAERLLGTRLVTFQTDARGQPVNQILIAKPCDIARELYLSAVLDRAQKRVVFMASTEGGVEIEKIAAVSPEKILQTVMNPLVGILPYQAREFGFKLGLTANQIKQFTHIMVQLGKLFVEKDLALLEVNPLIVTEQDDLLCLDGKITIDDNAMYRHPELQAMRDHCQEDERENRAQEHGLNYVALEGDIGCMVNGAGLAMATMDIIKLYGGKPANFLDVGGGATKDRVTEAFKIILSDHSVKAILVNIFGGIVRCDMIAEGIIAAVGTAGVQVPVVVRLEGNNAALGIEKLAASRLNIIPAKSLTEAAESIVKAAAHNPTVSQ